jgi:hypothetical protein
MQFEIITESNLAIGPFPDKQTAIAAAEDLGLGPMRDDDEDERSCGWDLSIVSP